MLSPAETMIVFGFSLRSRFNWAARYSTPPASVSAMRPFRPGPRQERAMKIVEREQLHVNGAGALSALAMRGHNREEHRDHEGKGSADIRPPIVPHSLLKW
jgi:hypothetical protein